MIYVGIDPGVNGGIAAVRDNGSIFRVLPMPETDADVFDAVRSVSSETGASRACLEFVRSSPQMGVKSAFTFGQGYGGLKMALTVARIPFDEVTPQKWQRALGCLSKGDKNVTKARAQQLFPIGVKITHAIADALLIAEYCRRFHGATARDLADSAVRAESQPPWENAGATSRCQRCDDLGIVEDPQHGHALTCPVCHGRKE